MTKQGIVFTPFGKEIPSDITAEEAFSSHAIHKAPINQGGGGWIEKPDIGKTDLSKDTPIGEPWILFFIAVLYCILKRFSLRKRLFFLLIPLLCNQANAAITALEFSHSGMRGGEDVTIRPTILSLPEGMVSVCWGLYYDAACEHAVADVHFRARPSEGVNAIQFTTPTTAGTYYIKSSLRTGNVCGGGSLDSYYVLPIVVYPSDADVVLSRNAQEAAERIDLTDASSIRAYGAMRFNRLTLNDALESPYKRYNYFISFPFDVQVADIYGIGSVGSEWLIYYYDGKGRAEEGFFAERTDNWVMIDDTDSVLHAGQGYLLQLNFIQMAADNEDIWANDADIATLYFPAMELMSSIDTRDETVPALGTAYQCTIDLSASLGSEGDRRTKDSYWRCLGVPSFTSPTGVEGLPYFYEWDMEDNSLHVRSSAAYTFEPMHAYLVQNGEEIVWTDVTKPAGMMAKQAETGYSECQLELRQGEKELDRTFVRMTDDDVTTGFDFGQDLIKEMNAGKANIYTMAGYERLAANVLPSGEQTVTIGVVIAEDGEYTFAMPEGMNATLIDHTTGVRTRLGTTDYTVSLTTGQYDGRFSIVFEQTETGVRTVTNDGIPVTGTRKMMIDGMLYIVKEGKMYDAHGFLVQKDQK